MAGGGLLLRYLGCFFSVVASLEQTVPWTLHGTWSLSRSIRVNNHFSCDFEVPDPIPYFTIELASALRLLDIETWSLLELSRSDNTILYRNKVTMYPPRISLQFHQTSFVFEEVSGTCKLRILPVPATLLPPPITTSTPAASQTQTETTTPFYSSPAFTWPSWTSQMIPPCHMKNILFHMVYAGSNYVEPDPYVPTTAPVRVPKLPPRFPRAVFGDDDLYSGGLIVPETVDFDYVMAISKSIKFYEAQRSGDFPPVPGNEPYEWLRPSGEFHVAPDGSDLSGGWYNGNDNVKLSFPMASATTVLAWGFQTWENTYIAHGLDQKMKEMLKWPLDYFLKSWKPDTETLYVHVGNLSLERTMFQRADDFMYSSLWESGDWPVYSVTPTNPGSDVAAEIASAMAISSQLNIGDSDYSTTLLETAKQLYTFAKTYRGKYSDHVPVAGHGYPDYRSSGYKDELCLSAAILYEVTSENQYLNDAEGFFDEILGEKADVFSWDSKHVACALKLYNSTLDITYELSILQFREQWANYDQSTPFSLVWKTENGTLGNTANAIFIVLQSLELGLIDNSNDEQDMYAWCTSQIHYILGNNNMMRSYQIGFNEEKDIQNPYHKNSACPHPAKQCGIGFLNSDNTNTNRLVGALVGGPDRNDYHDDSRQNVLGNSVAVDYNAGFQSALAGVQHKFDELERKCESLNAAETTFPTTELTTSDVTSATIYLETPYTTPLPTPIPTKPESFNYGDALKKSILFYAAQRSSKTEPDNNPISWRNWGEKNYLYQGGWYDDGSSIRTTKLMAGSVSVIGWGMVAFKTGYEVSNTLDDAYASIQWPLNYMRDALTEYNDGILQLIQKAGAEQLERSQWARPTDPYITGFISIENRIVSGDQSGADVAGDVATALAIGSVLFKEKNVTYSEELQASAKKMYSFAKTLNETYKDDSSVYYSEPGDSYEDEMCVAAWWMFKATNDLSYYQDGINYRTTQMSSNVLDWRDKHTLCLLLTYEQTGDFQLSYLLSNSLSYWEGNSGGVHYTPQGLAWHDTEPLKYAANAAFVQALAKTYGILTIGSVDEFSKKQIDYMLGNNDQAYSYQIGYGSRYPRRPHHRASSCPDYMTLCDWTVYNRPGKNPNELTGALVAGPDKNDVFEDVRSNYTMTRVSIEANAGFQSVLAYLVQTYEATTTTSSTTTKTTTTTTEKATAKTLKPQTTGTPRTKNPKTSKPLTPTKEPKPTTTRPVEESEKSTDAQGPTVTKQPSIPSVNDKNTNNVTGGSASRDIPATFLLCLFSIFVMLSFTI